MVVVLTGAFVGGLVSGLVGFGTALVALGIWLHVLSPVPAVALVAICSVVAQVQTLPAIWHAFDRDRAWPMIAAGLLGVPVGVWLLAYLDPHTFRFGMGLLLLCYAAFMTFHRPHQVGFRRGGRLADAGVGFGGGVLGGLAGLSGPLPAIWATLRGWSKDERRAVFQGYNTVILGSTVIAYAVSGRLDAMVWRLVLIGLPGTLTGAWIGSSLYRRLSDRHFHVVVLGVLAAFGMSLVWQEL